MMWIYNKSIYHLTAYIMYICVYQVNNLYHLSVYTMYICLCIMYIYHVDLSWVSHDLNTNKPILRMHEIVFFLVWEIRFWSYYLQYMLRTFCILLCIYISIYKSMYIYLYSIYIYSQNIYIYRYDEILIGFSVRYTQRNKFIIALNQTQIRF